MTERWDTGSLVETSPWPEQQAAALVRAMPELIVIEDTGVADTPVKVRHGLGRRPLGAVVFNQTVSGTTPAEWYRDTDDEDWTSEDVTMRWTVANAAVVIAVF